MRTGRCSFIDFAPATAIRSAASAIHLDRFLSGYPADDVEVVYAAVAEHAAGDGHVLRRGRFRVECGRPDGVDPPECSAFDRLACRGDGGVVPALEADLHGNL